MRLSNLSRACSLLAAAAALVGTTGTVAASDSATLARGRDTLRAMDRARCHGRDYRGWSGPSLLAAARESTLARFRRDVLEDKPGGGSVRSRLEASPSRDACRSTRRCRPANGCG